MTPDTAGTLLGMATRTDTTSEAILEAASRLLATEGPSALTVRRIATEAGGSTMNVYSRFGGKDGVVEALFLEGFRRLAEAMEETTDTDPLLCLDGCGEAYRRFATEHPTYYAIMFDGVIPDFEPSAGAKELAAGTLQLLAAKVERAMGAGELRPADPTHVAAGLWALNHGLVSLELKHGGPPDLDWEAIQSEALAAMIRGLMP